MTIKGVFNLGRKRSSTKKSLNLYIEQDIIETLKKLELNASVIFTDAAKKAIEKQKETKKQDELHE